MKKVITAGIGGRSFTVDEDAYNKLDAYLTSFRSKANMGYQSKEVMDEVEARIADILSGSLSSAHQDVVNLSMVNEVISRIGMPDGNTVDDSSFSTGDSQNNAKAGRKFYRDPDGKAIGGVCSGLAAYFDIDVTIIRIIFLVALICGSAGFWIYVIFWIVAPLARTASQKCEMRGIPATAENIRRFSGSR